MSDFFDHDARQPSRADERPSAPLPKGIKWGIAGLVVLFAGGFMLSLFFAQRAAVQGIASRLASIRGGIEDLQNFDLSSAHDKFSSAGKNASSSMLSSSGVFSVLTSVLSGGAGALNAFGDLSAQLTSLTQYATQAESDLFRAIGSAATATSTSTPDGSGGNGSSASPLVADLEGIRAALHAINADADQLSGTMSLFGGADSVLGSAGSLMGGAADSGTNYLALRAETQRTEKFLDGFVPWLADASTTHHVLVLFENPAEMRPGGGFIGSYADVSLRGGAVTGMEVHDIADADVGFAEKIIPPKPLQLEETGWRPADANWFFDFPASAAKAAELFEASQRYAASSTTFDAVIAVTPQAMRDVLAVTGPVSVPNAAIGMAPANQSTTFAADNVEQQIQAVVQAGQAKHAAGAHPKAVLGVLSQMMLADLASSTDAQKQQLLDAALNWTSQKDAMAYFKNPDFESFALAEGAAGDEYALPQNFNGDYLAIANADINSDKSELFIDQEVDLDVQIGADGTATDHLAVTRAHGGDKSPYWWYRTTNQDYLQAFVPAGSILSNASGGIAKTVPAPVNYARQGYRADPLLLAMESSTAKSFAYPAVTVRQGGGSDPGKDVFAAWVRTRAGSSSTITLDYSHALFAPPADGVQYQFVLERQSGAAGHYHFQVSAPLGYVFAENGLASYSYDEDGIPGRLVIPLTLKKL